MSFELSPRLNDRCFSVHAGACADYAGSTAPLATEIVHSDLPSLRPGVDIRRKRWPDRPWNITYSRKMSI